MSPSNPMRLVNVYRESTAVRILYSLLSARPAESRISHQAMPTYPEHAAFVRSKPYRMWWLIRVPGSGRYLDLGDGKFSIEHPFVGDLHVTHLNEIGVFLFPHHRGKGYGEQAVKLFMDRHRPLPAIPAKRVRRWLAHIAPENDAGASFFRKLGFRKVQETWQSAS